MKFARFFALAATVFQILGAAPHAAAQSSGSCIQEMLTLGHLRNIDYGKIKTVDEYCQSLRENGFCAINCESRLRDRFAEIKSEKERDEQKQMAARQEDERKAAAQQQAQAARAATLRSGQAKPANLKEAAIVYNAEHGGSLAGTPKIKPDGGMYYLSGNIKMAGDKPEFFAALSSSQDNELLANALRRSRGIGESTDYFAVVIPKQLQSYYFDKAKIEGGFDLVGRYVSNTKYKTVAGQEKSAPVFEAVYLVFWQ